MSADFKTVVHSIRDLPPMPIVAIKVLELLNDPNVNYEKLGEVISSDPAVAARMLKVANSAFYSMKRQIKTLEHAIAIVGERTLRSLVLAASLEGMNKSYGLLEKMLWEDSIGCAIGCRILARKFSSADPESELEGRFFPYAHAVVGAAVLDKWNFTRSLVMSTLHHEDLVIAVDEEEKGEALLNLTATVNLGGLVCRKLGIGQREPDEDLDILNTPGAKELDLDEEDVESALEEVNEVFAENRDFFIN